MWATYEQGLHLSQGFIRVAGKTGMQLFIPG